MRNLLRNETSDQALQSFEQNAPHGQKFKSMHVIPAIHSQCSSPWMSSRIPARTPAKLRRSDARNRRKARCNQISNLTASFLAAGGGPGSATTAFYLGDHPLSKGSNQRQKQIPQQRGSEEGNVKSRDSGKGAKQPKGGAERKGKQQVTAKGASAGPAPPGGSHASSENQLVEVPRVRSEKVTVEERAWKAFHGTPPKPTIVLVFHCLASGADTGSAAIRRRTSAASKQRAPRGFRVRLPPFLSMLCPVPT